MTPIKAVGVPVPKSNDVVISTQGVDGVSVVLSVMSANEPKLSPKIVLPPVTECSPLLPVEIEVDEAAIVIDVEVLPLER